MWDFAVSAVGEADAVGVEVDPGAVVFPDEVDDDTGAVWAGVGALAGFVFDPIDDHVFEEQVGVHRVVD